MHSKWMNQITFEDSTARRVSVKIIESSETFQLEDIRTLKDLDLPCQPVEMDITECVQLKNMDLPDTAGVTPEIMIGEDYTHVKMPLKVVIGKTHEPVATLTPLGWIVHGPFMAARFNKECILFVHHTEDDEDIGRQLKNFWNVESFGLDTCTKALRSKEDQRAEEILNQTARRRGDHWETEFLWKSDNEVLSESKKVAEQRFRTLEKENGEGPLFQRTVRKDDRRILYEEICENPNRRRGEANHPENVVSASLRSDKS